MEVMTEPTKSNREALTRLADDLADDILNTSDADILAEIRESNDDPKKIAAATRSLFDQASTSVAKNRMIAARRAMAANQRSPSPVVRLDSNEARRRLNNVLLAHPEAAEKLTLAARKGEGLSDNDVQGMLEDLEALGVIPPSDRGGCQ
jgi:DNA-binding TFAR19-related protein (PDSD5 family)